MESLKIVINSIEDAKNGQKPVGDLKPEDVIETKDVTCVILEKGMESGRSSLMFVARLENGKAVVFQLTPGHLEGLNSAYAGAIARFGS